MLTSDVLIKRQAFGSSSIEYGVTSLNEYYVEVYYENACIMRQLYKHRSSAIRCFNSYCVKFLEDK